MSDEALFYALFPALLWLGSRRPGGLAVVVGLAFAALVTAAVAHPTSDPYFWYYIFPIARLPEFALGVLLGIIFLRSPRSVPPIIEPFALVAVALGAVAAHFSNKALGQSLVFVPGFAIAIYVFADGRGILARGFRHPWLVTLGESSFMLYMIHALIARYVVRFSGLAHGNSLIAFPVSIVASVLLWRYCEQPTRRWVLGIS